MEGTFNSGFQSLLNHILKKKTANQVYSLKQQNHEETESADIQRPTVFRYCNFQVENNKIVCLRCLKTFTGFPGGPSGKETACQCRRHETLVQFLGWEDPLEKEMATPSSILAWRIPWTEEPLKGSPLFRPEGRNGP